MYLNFAVILMKRGREIGAAGKKKRMRHKGTNGKGEAKKGGGGEGKHMNAVIPC